MSTNQAFPPPTPDDAATPVSDPGRRRVTDSGPAPVTARRGRQVRVTTRLDRSVSPPDSSAARPPGSRSAYPV